MIRERSRWLSLLGLWLNIQLTTMERYTIMYNIHVHVYLTGLNISRSTQIITS